MQHSDPLMTELIPAINEIVKYGIQLRLTIADRYKTLDKISLKFTACILKSYFAATSSNVDVAFYLPKISNIIRNVRQRPRHCCEVNHFDKTDYPDFNKSVLPDIRQDMETNFKDFKFYKTTADIINVDN